MAHSFTKKERLRELQALSSLVAYCEQELALHSQTAAAFAFALRKQIQEEIGQVPVREVKFENKDNVRPLRRKESDPDFH